MGQLRRSALTIEVPWSPLARQHISRQPKRLAGGAGQVWWRSEGGPRTGCPTPLLAQPSGFRRHTSACRWSPTACGRPWHRRPQEALQAYVALVPLVESQSGSSLLFCAALCAAHFLEPSRILCPSCRPHQDIGGTGVRLPGRNPSRVGSIQSGSSRSCHRDACRCVPLSVCHSCSDNGCRPSPSRDLLADLAADVLHQAHTWFVPYSVPLAGDR